MKVSILLKGLVAGVCCGFVSCALDRKEETSSSSPGLRGPFRPRQLTQGTFTQMFKEDEIDRNEDLPTTLTKARALGAEQMVLPDWELSFDIAEIPTDGMLDELARATNQHVKWFLRFVLQPTGVNLLRARNKITTKTGSFGHQDRTIHVVFATRLFFQEDKGLPPQSPQEIVGGLVAAFEGLLIDHYTPRFATFFSDDNVFHGATRIKAIRPAKGWHS